jgi:hypothetical protein
VPEHEGNVLREQSPQFPRDGDDPPDERGEDQQ